MMTDSLVVRHRLRSQPTMSPTTKSLPVLFSSLATKLFNGDHDQFRAIEVPAPTTIVGIGDREMSIMLNRARIRKTDKTVHHTRESASINLILCVWL